MSDQAQTLGQVEPQTIERRESYAEVAFIRDIQKQRDRYQIVMADKRFIPDGAELVECYKSKGGSFFIMGDPEPNDESHDCDVMGCGSLSHVIAIVEPGAPSILRENEELVRSIERAKHQLSKPRVCDLDEINSLRAEVSQLRLDIAEAHRQHNEEASDWKTDEELAAELARLRGEIAGRAENVSKEEANELQGVLRTTAPTGRAFITSARVLVATLEKVKAERALLKEKVGDLMRRVGFLEGGGR